MAGISLSRCTGQPSSSNEADLIILSFSDSVVDRVFYSFNKCCGLIRFFHLISHFSWLDWPWFWLVTASLVSSLHTSQLEVIIRHCHLRALARSTTRLQRRRHKICILNWEKQKFCTPFTCFSNSVHFFQVLGKSATWNDHFSSFTENVNTQAQIWIFFSSVDTAPLTSVPG